MSHDPLSRDASVRHYVVGTKLISLSSFISHIIVICVVLRVFGLSSFWYLLALLLYQTSPWIYHFFASFWKTISRNVPLVRRNNIQHSLRDMFRAWCAFFHMIAMVCSDLLCTSTSVSCFGEQWSYSCRAESIFQQKRARFSELIRMLEEFATCDLMSAPFLRSFVFAAWLFVCKINW